jgi:hypothetical protein
MTTFCNVFYESFLSTPEPPHLLVKLVVEPLAEGDVVCERVVLYPGLLRHVGHAPVQVRHAARPLHVTEQGGQQRGLPAPHLHHTKYMTECLSVYLRNMLRNNIRYYVQFLNSTWIKIGTYI